MCAECVYAYICMCVCVCEADRSNEIHQKWVTVQCLNHNNNHMLLFMNPKKILDQMALIGAHDDINVGQCYVCGQLTTFPL